MPTQQSARRAAERRRKRAVRLAHFDPDNNGTTTKGLFGLPFSADESEIVVLGVGWDATASYGRGTAGAPAAVSEASLQIDLYRDGDERPAWEQGFAAELLNNQIVKYNDIYCRQIDRVIGQGRAKGKVEGDPQALLRNINHVCERLHDQVAERAGAYLDDGQIVGVLGGEHSTAFGLLKALAERYESFGILQIDAHADLREAYQGLTHSHASVMYNALNQLPQIERQVIVGLRDYSSGEAELIRHSDGHIVSFTSASIDSRLYSGNRWAAICEDIIAALPATVYISFDIDGLDPAYCPNTGTPVPGGLSYGQAVYLLNMLRESDKRIIGFDLCEVGVSDTTDYDANVGMRILYELCRLAALQDQKSV